MQYLLTKDEYEALRPLKDFQARGEALEVARKIIVELSGMRCGIDYCSRCPISHINDDGLEGPERDISYLICSKHRDYPK